MFRNTEGYSDPTAGLAMSNLLKEYRQKQRVRYANKNRRKIYVVSPYAGNVAENVAATVRYCRKVIDDGYMPVAGHLLYPQILDDNDPEERDLGLLFGLALLRTCDEVWVFGTVSDGVEKEIEEAKRLKKRVRYMEEVS